MTYDTLFFVTEFSAAFQSTQSKPEGRKTLMNLENNIDYLDFSGPVSPQRRPQQLRERSSHLVEVKAKTYYSLKSIPRKFRKYLQVESILIHLQNAPIYHAKYKKEKSEVKALMELIK